MPITPFLAGPTLFQCPRFLHVKAKPIEFVPLRALESLRIFKHTMGFLKADHASTVLLVFNRRQLLAFNYVEALCCSLFLFLMHIRHHGIWPTFLN